MAEDNRIPDVIRFGYDNYKIDASKKTLVQNAARAATQ